jgi:hypothetical protein
MSTFVQCAGHAECSVDWSGLAVLLVENSVYEADILRLKEAVSTSEIFKKSVCQSSTYPKATKQYTPEHGVLH